MIRDAKIEDVEQLLPMTKDFVEAIPYGRLNHRDDDSAKAMISFIKDEVAVFKVDASMGKISGGIAGFIHPWLCDSSQSILQEFWWYVDPKLRGKFVGPKLLKAFIKEGKKRGVDFIIVSAFNKHIESFYYSQGFEQLETHLIKRLKK